LYFFCVDKSSAIAAKNLNNKKLIMSNETATLNIGPGAIATPSTPGAPGFALSATEWLAIQTYVIDALALPTTMDAFKAGLGSGAPSDLSDFQQLVTSYGNINSHVTTWQNDTFPASVSLASDIYSYAQQAPTYYNPILPLAQALTINPNDEQAKAELTAILGVLSTAATLNHDKAADVFTKIQTFANQTQADKTTLSGTDGKGGLQKYYNDKYGATSAEVTTLTEQLKGEQAILDAANAEYAHDVIVASTTPTYGWIFPFGTIAAAIVAGIYGDKAIKALERGNAAKQQIANMDAKLAADATLMIVINKAESGISNILDPLNAALPIVQKIQGIWGAIADDLGNIISLIKNNIQDALPIIMNLGVQASLNAWTAVGLEADAYRKNAYITVKK
jgi:Bacillus haemolytic enterotoxin (HBL)